MCVCQFLYVCVFVCVYVTVNTHACHIWIINDITHYNTCLFSVAGFFFYSVLE